MFSLIIWGNTCSYFTAFQKSLKAICVPDRWNADVNIMTRLHFHSSCQQTVKPEVHECHAWACAQRRRSWGNLSLVHVCLHRVFFLCANNRTVQTVHTQTVRTETGRLQDQKHWRDWAALLLEPQALLPCPPLLLTQSVTLVRSFKPTRSPPQARLACSASRLSC